MDQPMVIISASGMCEAGRILHHLKNNIEDARNTILMVGFQAEHTLGRRILEREETVPIFGERYRIKAQVQSIDGYSAHADRDELLGWVRQLGPQRLQRVFLVHGEDDALRSYDQGLEQLGVRRREAPIQGEMVTV
jgi:metallo-beta-lactamase family protein